MTVAIGFFVVSFTNPIVVGSQLYVLAEWGLLVVGTAMVLEYLVERLQVSEGGEEEEWTRHVQVVGRDVNPHVELAMSYIRRFVETGRGAEFSAYLSSQLSSAGVPEERRREALRPLSNVEEPLTRDDREMVLRQVIGNISGIDEGVGE